jgi:hypothetical protein
MSVKAATSARLALAIAAIALLPAVLAGCAGAPSGGGETGDNGAATSGPAPEGGDGGGDPNAQVPATFPDDVPLLDADVLESADLGTGWVVLFGVDDAIASFNEGADALAAAGFVEDARTTDDTQGFGNYTNELYTVQISANTDYPGYGQAVSYTVVKRG